MAEPDAPSPKGAGGALQKKYGPLPLGIWLLVIGGSLALAFYLNSRNKESDAGTATEDENSYVVDAGDGQYSTVGSGAGGGSSTGSTGSPTYADNDAWYQAAVNYLIAQGYNAGTADAAIRKYLAGATLSVQEQALVNVAITKLGVPPSPLPPPETTPGTTNPNPDDDTTTPPTPTPTTKTITVTVKKWPDKFGSLWGIANYYYGNGAMWTKIYNANKSQIANPDIIQPGQKLVVPDATKNI